MAFDGAFLHTVITDPSRLLLFLVHLFHIL